MADNRTTTAAAPARPHIVQAAPQPQDTIDLLELAGVLWNKVLYVIVAALLGGAIALAASFFFMTPKYSATTTMYVNASNISLGSTSVSLSASDLTTSDKMVDIYITILQSRETLKEVAENAEMLYDYEKMSKMISAQAGSGSGVFTVTVESTSPTEAELLANTIAAVLPSRISDIVDGTSARVIEYAVVPTERSSPSYMKNTAMGILLGMVLACGVITVQFLIESGRDTVIHSADELMELYPEIPVLATVMDMRLSGKKGYGYGYNYGYGYYEEAEKNAKKKDKQRKAKKAAEEKEA